MKANKKIKRFSLKKKLAKKNAKGFTLVELIVVIAIIGVLAVVLVPNMMKYVKNAGLTKANDAAAKVAEQANLIATEMELTGNSLSGTYSCDVTLKDSSGAEATAFNEALNKAVNIPDGTKITIIFDGSSGQVSGVAYQETTSDYVGLYPNPSNRDGSSENVKNYDESVKLINGSSSTGSTEASDPT
jgi:type IV pilus assembly protein PilA